MILLLEEVRRREASRKGGFEFKYQYNDREIIKEKKNIN